MRLLPTAALLCALISTCATAAPSEKKDKSRFLVFGEGDNWALFDVNSHKAERLHFPPTHPAENAAVTADGRWLVFTAYDPKASNVLLFKWDRSGSDAPVRLGPDHGYHSDPAFSTDERFVYFAHHPAGGPPGKHTTKAYAQMYRVQLDGSGLEALTAEPGCHFGAAPTSGDALFFVHTRCQLTNSIVRYDLKTRKSRQLDRGEEILLEPSATADGKRVLFVKRMQESDFILEATWPGWRVRTLLELPKTMKKVRPRYGASQTELLYQAGGAIWAFDGKTSSRLFSLSTP